MVKTVPESKFVELKGLDRISLMVHEMRCLWREINKDDVGIFYVYQEDGKTLITELEFTADGSYQMPGFYDVTRKQLQEWIQLKIHDEKKK